MFKLVEFRSPDRSEPLEKILRAYLKRTFKMIPGLEEEAFSKPHFVYVSDKRWDNLRLKIKPKSKILFCFSNERFQNKVPPLDPGSIVHESGEIVVLNKPTGLPTQKTLKPTDTNLYDEVRLHYLKQKDFPKGLPYVGLHHRLDRDTSGLVLMTKKRSFNKDVADLFKNKMISKKYLAIVESEETPPPNWIDKSRIKRSFTPKHPFYFTVCKKGGQEAISTFETIEELGENKYLISCFPKTGRTHQLRVHLSHRGFPIVGDPVYGTKNKETGLLLHASELKFKLKGEEFHLKCDPEWL